MKALDEFILDRLKVCLGESIYQNVLSLTGSQVKEARVLAAATILQLGMSRRRQNLHSSDGVDWPLLEKLVPFLVELTAVHDKEGYLDLLELLANLHRLARIEEGRLVSLNERLSTESPKVILSLREIASRTGDASLYLPLLRSKSCLERCLGSYCLSRLSKRDQLEGFLLAALEEEVESVALAGLLLWAADWGVHREQLKKNLSNQDPWIRSVAAFGLYESDAGIHGCNADLIMVALSELGEEPHRWQLVGWGTLELN